MREEQELSAAMERVLKLADYLVSVPTDHYTRRPPHPYEGHPSCANRQAADDLRTVLHAARSNPPQEERSDPLDLAAADDNHDLERLRVAARHPKDPTGWKVHNPHFLDWLSENVGPENIAYLRALIARPARSPGYDADDNHKALVEAATEAAMQWCVSDMACEPDKHDRAALKQRLKAAFQSRKEEK